MKRLAVVIAIVSVYASAHEVMAGPKMYWSDRGANTIRRAELDGSQVEILAEGMKQVRGFAIDFENEVMYWADNGLNLIQRRDLAGGPVEDLVSGLSFPAGVDLDVPGGKMYWADATTGMIQRANLDGTLVEDLVTGLDSPYFVRLDLTNNHIYWTDHGADKIQRSDLDGKNLVDLVTTGLVLPRGIDLDLQHGKMYWTDRGTDKVQRANLDGSGIETLYTAQPPPRVDAAPHGIALDVARGHMYWVDNGLVTIQRATLDGKNVTDILTADSGQLNKPWEILLDLRSIWSCDLNGDGICDASDIDAMTRIVLDGSYDPTFDLNDDQLVNREDRRVWVKELMSSYFGDSNLDLAFNSSDLTEVFEFGKYEDDIRDNAGWSEGDWDGDLDFTTSDLVVAFKDGGYTQGAVRAASVVPEPASVWSLLTGLIVLGLRRSKRPLAYPSDC